MFDLASDGGSVYAATDGGLLRLDDGRWQPVSSPSGLRRIEGLQPLGVLTSSLKALFLKGSDWALGKYAYPDRDINHGIMLDPTGNLRNSIPQLANAVPPAFANCLLRKGDGSFVGTEAGLYFYQRGSWRKEVLPSQLSVSRPNGIAEIKGQFVVGGMDGLYIGSPGSWQQVAGDSIRLVRQVGQDVWVVHGNGALDKLDCANGQLYPDVLTGDSKRPWTASIGVVDGRPLFGGLGGWSERSKVSGERFPSELDKDVVTAIDGRGDARWIGTEQSGLFRFSKQGIHRWNPGNGLTDTWVTSLCRSPAGLLVGTLHFGLFIINGDSISPVPAPTQRITSLCLWENELVVGGMDGAWLRRGGKWIELKTQGEETTSMSVAGKRLLLTTATGVYFFG